MIRSALSKIRPVHAVMGLVFAVGLVVTGFKFLDAREVGAIMSRLRLWTVPILLGLPLGFLWLKSLRFVDLFQITGRPVVEPSARWLARLSYISAQLATLLPGGYVARVGLMESSLKMGTRAVLPTLVEKILDLTLLGLLGLMTCLLFPETEQYAAIFLALVSVTALLGASETVRHRLQKSVTWVVSKVAHKTLVRAAFNGRFPHRRLAAKFVLQTLGVLAIELTTLWMSFYALGVPAPLLVVVLGYAVADLIGRVAPTPGGFGLTEVGMVASLSQLGGMGINEAAAGTFLFRFLLFLLPALYGSACYLFLWVPATARYANGVPNKASPGLSGLRADWSFRRERHLAVLQRRIRADIDDGSFPKAAPITRLKNEES